MMRCYVRVNTAVLRARQHVIGDRFGGRNVATPAVNPGPESDTVGRLDGDGHNASLAVDGDRRTVGIEFADFDSDAAFDAACGCSCRILEPQQRRMGL